MLKMLSLAQGMSFLSAFVEQKSYRFSYDDRRCLAKVLHMLANLWK